MPQFARGRCRGGWKDESVLPARTSAEADTRADTERGAGSSLALGAVEYGRYNTINREINGRAIRASALLDGLRYRGAAECLFAVYIVFHLIAVTGRWMVGDGVGIAGLAVLVWLVGRTWLYVLAGW
jgi:hypothetical protein